MEEAERQQGDPQEGKVVSAFANSRPWQLSNTKAKLTDQSGEGKCSRALCTSVQSSQTPTESSWGDSQDPMDARMKSLTRE